MRNVSSGLHAATTHPKEDDVDGATRELSLQLRELDRGLRLVKQRYRTGLPVGSVAMLRYIDEPATGCSGRDLAARTGLDPSTVSRAVASLVGLGLVERRADPTDGRASVLGLTPAGRSALADAHTWYSGVLDRALAAWTPDEVAALAAALARFGRDLDQFRTDNHTLEAAR
jgi:DNA-binding MarR family transcriptional regulator